MVEEEEDTDHVTINTSALPGTGLYTRKKFFFNGSAIKGGGKGRAIKGKKNFF